MMQYFFPEHHYLPIAAAFVLNFLCVLITYFFLFKLRFLAFLIENPPVPPFLTIPVAFLSLMVAFMAAYVWQNSAVANGAAMNERSALKALHAMPLGSAESRREVHALLDRYLLQVKTKEWGLNFNMARDEDVDAVLKQLLGKAWAMGDLETCVSTSSTKCPPEAAVAEFIRSLEKLVSAREERLLIGKRQSGEYWGRWVLLYLLALMSYVGIGAVHRPSPRTAQFALTVTCMSVVLAFSMITLYIHPYKGPNAVMPSFLDMNEDP